MGDWRLEIGGAGSNLQFFCYRGKLFWAMTR